MKTCDLNVATMKEVCFVLHHFYLSLYRHIHRIKALAAAWKQTPVCVVETDTPKATPQTRHNCDHAATESVT